MMSIGGYLELELPNYNTIFHDQAIKLNSGRNALAYICIQNEYKKVYLPHYTCEVTLQPLNQLNIDFEFYYLDKNFIPIITNELNNDEALLYVNYYGIMDNNIPFLSNYNLIVDNSQAFYNLPLKDISTFYSPRKFFGLPDGGLAFVDVKKNIELPEESSLDRLTHLYTRIEAGAEAGYEAFKRNDKKLNNLPLANMSRLTMRLMQGIDFLDIKKKRIDNFERLHARLKKYNELTSIIESNDFECPMIYPFLKSKNEELRSKLNSNKIYNAVYWPNIKNQLNINSFEVYLIDNLIALPIDQRLTEVEMDRISNFIENKIDG